MEIQKKLYEEFPCRQNQIDTLYNILGRDGEHALGCVFVHGPTATGKSSVVERLLQLTDRVHFVINCIECYTARLALEPAARALCQSDTSERVDSVAAFARRLKQAHASGAFTNRSVVVVLDGCERLADLGPHYLPAFARLQEITDIPTLTVILISHILPEKFLLDSVYVNVNFPQYTRNELIDVLTVRKVADCDKNFYRDYLNVFLGVFLRATRCLDEIHHLATSHFPQYVAPVESGQLKASDVAGLWRNIAPRLKSSLDSVYLGIDSGDHVDDKREAKKGRLLTPRAQQALDLPYFAKHFLVAAFLASHNPPSTDRRLFAKSHGRKQRKRALVGAGRRENAVDALLGPRSFSLDRLFAIFYSLLDQRTNLTASLMIQISSLVELGFLVRQGDGLELPKYKAMVGFDCVDPVARTLGLNVKKYMVS
ncbi:origin recognition complex subunit 5 [Nilaparvata lugens]|uniref:origin recognition complex subunit 5 n=1 Tax=Nilaparvata lugens TaxID=108931 RepID=UPI00193E5519|nr:origin recognition complex subunit 5 [Nilaparvata lugens]